MDNVSDQITGVDFTFISVLTSELTIYRVIVVDNKKGEFQPLPLFSCTYSVFYKNVFATECSNKSLNLLNDSGQQPFSEENNPLWKNKAQV